jgi:hypothetical protein
MSHHQLLHTLDDVYLFLYCSIQELLCRLTALLVIKCNTKWVFSSARSIVWFDYRLDDQGLIPGRGKGFLLKPLHPDQLGGQPSLLLNR